MIHVDVAIIGAGINGAGTARELSRRGYSVILVDKGDIGSGTSSASSKLLHGGIRYLENGELKLVFEACQERYHWIKNAPHLAKKQSFIIPIYRHHKRKKWMIHAGILLYGLLSGFRQAGRNRMLSVTETVQRQPGLNPKGLLGAALYYDAQVDDARMCLECALQAESWDAKVYTYHQIDSITTHEKGHLLSGKNILKNKNFAFTARTIFQATGPWTDIANHQWQTETAALMRPSIGSHIITEAFLQDDALLISANDGRVFFAIPWHGKTLIGTTDHPYIDNPDNANISESDIRYLFENIHTLMPSLKKPLTLYGVFTGVRPLTRDTHNSVGATSREHAFTWLSDTHLCVTGGKYTTFRRIAEEAADLIAEKLPTPSVMMAPIDTLFGGKPDKDFLLELQKEAPYLDAATCQHLIDRYAVQARHVLPYLSGRDNSRQLVPVGGENPPQSPFPLNGEARTALPLPFKKRGGWKGILKGYRPFDPIKTAVDSTQKFPTGLLRGEIGYMIAIEKAKTLDDILRRRTNLFVGLTPALLEEVAQACLEAWGWTDHQKHIAITEATERYIHALNRLSQPHT